MRNLIFTAAALIMPGVACAGGEPTTLPAANLDLQTVITGSAITPDLRLRVTTSRAEGNLLLPNNGYMQRRTTGAMLDYYPDGSGHGFHLSVGPRYFARTNYAREAQRRTGGVLYAPDFRITGLRGGYKSYAPTAMMGYVNAVARNVVMGIEGGAMMGAAYNSGPRAPGARFDTTGLNPMAHLMFGLKF